MKVKCRSCGKRFDYEECGGMCPKCSAYYQIDVAPQEDMFGERFKDQYEYNDATQENTTYVAETKQRISPLTVLLVVLMIVVIAIPISAMAVIGLLDEEPIEQSAIKKEESVIWNGNTTALTPLKLLETFSYDAVDTYNYEGTEEHTLYNICITDVKVADTLNEEIPDGYELFEVSYEISEEGEQEEEQGQTNNEENAYLYSIYTNPYLVTKSGKYVKPLETYFMEELLNYDYNELEQQGINSEFSYSKGHLYFITKKGDVAGLRVFCQRYDSENHQVTEIFAGYEIDLGGDSRDLN